MKHLAVLAALLAAAPAFAQSPGTVNLIGPSSTPGAPQVTTVLTVNNAINAALTAKADAIGGVLTNPAITGGTIAGTPISGAPGSFTTLGSSGNATIGGTLGVTGALTGSAGVFSGTLGVTGATTLGGALSVAGTSTMSGLVHMAQPASIQFDGTRTWSGSQTAIGNGEIYSFTNQSGSTNAGPAAAHYLGIASDTVHSTGVAFANLQVDTTTGAGILGGRNDILSSLTIGATPGDAGQYSAGQFAAQATGPANAGGNLLYGTNPTCGINGTATGSWSCIGEEIDIAARAGSAPLALTGLTIVTVAGHAVHGSTNLDSAIAIGNQPGTTTGWDYVLRIGGPGTAMPLVSSATLLYAYPATGGLTIANGVNFAALTFTGNSWNDGHVVLTGSGTSNLNAGTGLSLSATAGFVQLPFTAGIPSGAPSGNTNCAIDTTNGYLNCYYGAAWHKVAFAAGAG